MQQVGLTTSSHTLETSEPARSMSMLQHAFTTVKNVLDCFADIILLVPRHTNLMTNSR